MTTKMKDSGVEWIGEIPEDWELVRISSVVKERSDKVSSIDYEPLSVTKQGVVPQLEGVAKSNNPNDRKKVIKGDFVINSRSDRKQSCGIAPVDGSVSLINIILKLKRILPEYTKYLLDNYGFAEEFYRWGTGIVDDLWSTNYEKMKRIIIPLPPQSQQKSIANFLDIKTQEIDNIISKTKKAIEEYKKYKQSLITETVTKGLDKNVKMKDSGIEWIGEIPEHWDIIRPNRVCKILRGNSSFQKIDLESKGDYIALQYGRTYKVDIVDDSYRHYVDRSFYKSDQIVENGDTVLISTSETMEDLGHSCFYNRDDIGLLGGEQMCLKPNKDNVQGKFLYYATKYFHIELNQYATGLKVYRFRLDDLKKINIVLPPKDEQYKIISFLDEKLPLIDQIISTKEKLLIEMEAYKKSLIYETVTGKREVE